MRVTTSTSVWQKLCLRCSVGVYTTIYGSFNVETKCIMPESCCVIGCTVRRNSESRKAGIRLFRIPLSCRKRAAWIRAICRKHWEPKKWERVCSKHFLSGEPSDSPDDVDYRPTLFMKGDTEQPVVQVSTPRAKRATKRQQDSHMRLLVKCGNA